MPPDDGAATALVDARGLRCPLPALKAEKAIAGLAPGAVLIVLATDPMASVDIPFFCRKHGHACTRTAEGDVLRFAIVVGAREG